MWLCKFNNLNTICIQTFLSDKLQLNVVDVQQNRDQFCDIHNKL